MCKCITYYTLKGNKCIFIKLKKYKFISYEIGDNKSEIKSNLSKFRKYITLQNNVLRNRIILYQKNKLFIVHKQSKINVRYEINQIKLTNYMGKKRKIWLYRT